MQLLDVINATLDVSRLESGHVPLDIHPVQRAKSDLAPFMTARWREHMASFGGHIRQGLFAGQNVYPRMMAGGPNRNSS